MEISYHTSLTFPKTLAIYSYRQNVRGCALVQMRSTFFERASHKTASRELANKLICSFVKTMQFYKVSLCASNSGRKAIK